MKKKSISFVILAAGVGSRMKGLLPKVLYPLAGKPMIKYLIESILSSKKSFKLDKLIIVTGYKADLVEKVVGNYNGEVKFVRQKQQTGTANAVLSVVKEFNNKYDNNLVILSGDAPLINIKNVVNFVNSKLRNDLCVVAFKTDVPFGYGRVIVNKNGYAEKIIEERDANKEEKKYKLCNSGVIIGKARYIFQCVANIENSSIKREKYLTDIVSIANNDNKKVQIFESEEKICKGINDKVALSMAEKDVQDKLRKQAMKNGAILVAPDTVFFTSDTIIGKDVYIGPNVYFGKGVVVDNNVTIHPFCHLEGVHIKSNSIIGPFARLRPDTKIGKGSKIGNFVEIKKSNIGPGSKINHLSYVGDTNIGNNVNIGAGVITCNYDGKKKNSTNIGKESFVGSNVSLVAPLKIGKNVVLGAGSVITKSVPDGSLAVERSKQVNIKKKPKRKSNQK